MTAYLCLNVMLAFGFYGDTFFEVVTFSSSLSLLTGSSDYNVQADVHRPFYIGNERLQEFGRMKDHLKKLFRLLYVSDMIVRESGEEVDWEGLVRGLLHFLFHIKLEAR